MRDRPEGLDEGLLRPALREWGIDAVALDYAPVGFGDYHWVADGRWFVTVADVRRRPYDGLQQAMETAAVLSEQAGLGFVVAPMRAADGTTLRRLDRHRYVMSVFPYLDGAGGDFGDEVSAEERGRVIDLLAELHRTPPPLSTPARPVDLAGRAWLEDAIRETDHPWLGGPYAEPARALIADHAVTLRRRLEELDRMAEKGGEPVVTHGEPHPGNLLRKADGRLLLVDWDTVGMAIPERDLWHVAKDPADLARYADAVGRTPDPAALELYRLRWALDDVAEFVAYFRSPHGRTPDAEQSWAGLAGTLEGLAGTFPAQRPSP
ncbi:aminoglycoside phosphotransferase family protein [Nonomuraea turcica]|uniref:aminoglycoside phosphotransferase family protein n=1 Tax=Nonomuraea sp. G32 TaxID=3067274 RepID=UPI00273AC8EB|nr:aminoglycoside phosphotransferase family protein [Nonomuraea sp. G32]MDP4508918.1 aminoglycoside phosphotransferase family protein [Nonomuraea sp. G32]